MTKAGSSFNFITYFNHQEFQKDEFSVDGRVENKSFLTVKFTVSDKAVWTEAWVEYNELIDEVDLF